MIFFEYSLEICDFFYNEEYFLQVEKLIFDDILELNNVSLITWWWKLNENYS